MKVAKDGGVSHGNHFTSRIIKKALWKRAEYHQGLERHNLFKLSKAKFLGIMGSSGSGKTTLLNCLATIIKPTDGSIQMQEKDLGQLKGSQLF